MVLTQHAAGALFARRRRRQETFGRFADLFADPAWDILLLLFQHHHDRTTHVQAACDASQAPKATALRIIGTLEERGLIRRIENPRDYRSRLVELTDDGLELVSRALAAGAD